MAQVDECIEKSLECAKLRDAIPKSCIHKSATSNCKCKTSTACQKFRNCGYKYVQPSKPAPCKPTLQRHASNAPFAENSVYNCSFPCYDPEVISGSRQQAVVHKDQLVMAGEFQDETVHKMSYQVQCVSMSPKIIPKDHCLMGKGPMRMLTTQKHDFYDVCGGFGREKSFTPHTNLKLSDCPMTALTTTRCSYKPVSTVPVKNYKPDICYIAPTGNMDMNTVHRSSYKDVGVPEKPETPWAVKLDYCRPKDAIECCSVYNKSYMEPGTYVLKDNCGNAIDVVAGGKIDEDCCPYRCLAENVEQRMNLHFTKAHQFDDDKP